MSQNILNKDAAFFHVTTIENMEGIKKNGLNRNEKGQIFVSSRGELSILLGIALLQLPEIYQSEGIVFLKMTQNEINITDEEIKKDRQTNEWTKNFQYIITRSNIPANQIKCLGSLYLRNVDLVQAEGGTFPQSAYIDCFNIYMNKYIKNIHDYCCNFYKTHNEGEIGEEFKKEQSTKILEIISNLESDLVRAPSLEERRMFEHNKNTLQLFM